jgi:CRISPR-associated protein Cst1
VFSDIVPIYLTESWRKTLFSVFPNNAVTNPSIKNKEGKLKELFEGLVLQIEPLKEAGNCISCGKRDVKSPKDENRDPFDRLRYLN